MTSVKSGLLPAVQETRTVGASGTNSTVYTAACRAGGGAGVNVHNVTIPAGTLAARFALYDDDTIGRFGFGSGPDRGLACQYAHLERQRRLQRARAADQSGRRQLQGVRDRL
ncbi:hypothetical protein LP420_15490 [Massilia sp. B-10]|nr:hypothetical protein LP420_15490 [Massilia sp. B-10]